MYMRALPMAHFEIIIQCDGNAPVGQSKPKATGKDSKSLPTCASTILAKCYTIPCLMLLILACSKSLQAGQGSHRMRYSGGVHE